MPRQEQNDLVELLESLKSETANTKVWKEFKFWGQTSENAMLAQANTNWVFVSYDITMKSHAGTIQRADSKWIVGYKFVITTRIWMPRMSKSVRSVPLPSWHLM